MSNNKLSEVDGLVHPELVGVEVIDESGGDISRGDVILKGALAAGAVYGTFMVGPFVRSAFAMGGGSSDVDILNFALTLEYLESTFYEEAKKKVKASGELKSLISMLASDEKQHVEALEGTIKKLGGKPVAEADLQLRIQRHLRLPEARRNVRERRRRRLQRCRPGDQVERSPRRRRLDRPGRGPPRRRDRPPERPRTGPRSVRQSARRKGSPEGRRTLHRLTPARLRRTESPAQPLAADTMRSSRSGSIGGSSRRLNEAQP